MFHSASKFNGDISGWNVSDVTNMEAVFTANNFNQDLSSWDTSSVTTMKYMFSGNSKFNSDISGWNVSSVTNMEYVFQSATNFNSNISGWDVSSATTMRSMFEGASNFNQDLSKWDLQSVRNMERMFKSAGSFNKDISGWNVSAVTNMKTMFWEASSFNQDIGSWDVSSVTDMSWMFRQAHSFNQDIGNWDVSGTTNMQLMFYQAFAFNQDLTGWRVCQFGSKPTSFDSSANAWASSNKPKWGAPCINSVSPQSSIKDYGLGSNIIIAITFNEAVIVNGNPNLELKIGQNYKNASYNSGNGTSSIYFNYTVQEDDTTNKLDYSGMHSLTLNGGSITASDDGKAAVLTLPNIGISSHSISVLGSNSFAPIVDSLSINNNLTSPAVVGDRTPTITFEVTDSTEVKRVLISVNGGNNITLQGVGTKKSKNYTYTPTTELTAGNHTIQIYAEDNYGASEIYSYEFMVTSLRDDFVSYWDTTKTNQGSSNSSQISLPLQSGGDYDFVVYWGDGSNSTVTSHNDPDKIHNYKQEGLYRINIVGKLKGFRFGDAGDKKKLISIKRWGSMNLGNSGGYFNGATNLKSIEGTPNLTGTTNFAYMFQHTWSFNSNLSSWNTSAVTNMRFMFKRSGFNQDLSGWDTSSVTSFESMFYQAGSFNSDLDSWNTSSVTNMASMFEEARKFNGSISTWDTSSVTTMRHMLFRANNFDSYIGDWDVGRVTNMRYMFTETRLNQNLSKWDVSSVIDMYGIFQSTPMSYYIRNWNICKVTQWGYFGGSFPSGYGPKFGHPCVTSVTPKSSLKTYGLGRKCFH